MMKPFNIKLIFSILLIVAATVAGTWWKLNQKTKATNVIVILVDTLRADHLSLYGYERSTSPNLDKLAEESLVFSRAISTASWTPPGTTSVLSGLYPTTHTNQPPKRLTTAAHLGNKIPPEVKLLPVILKEQLYQTAALTSNPWITEEFGFDRGFDRFYYSKHIDAKNLIERSKKTIDRFLQNSDTPFFLYLHLIDPHAPYTAHSEFPFQGKLSRGNYSEEAMGDINAYDSEIAFTDFHLGRLFDYLKSKGLYEDSIIVVVSDHGEAFHEHGITGHGFNLHIEEVHVPLIIKGIGKTGFVTEAVSQVDIVPTLLDKLKIAAPYALDGISLLNPSLIKQRAGVYSETYRIYRQRAFSTVAGERLIVEMGDIENPKELMSKKGLYDLNKDPYESNSIEDAPMYDELRSYLESMVAKNIPITTPQEVEIESKTVEQLETLGYIN